MRRPHPYFVRIGRRVEPAKAEPGRPAPRKPLIKPTDEPGILWAPFRDEEKPA